MNLFLSFLWYLLPANPMLLRIVKGGSVRQRDFYVRLGYLSAMMALVFFGLFSQNQAISGTLSIAEMAKAGATTFNVIAFGQVALVCLIAPLYMSGAIAAERAGQTFNILMTTPMTNLQVVLGSLFGRLYFVFALLLSGLPIFMILLVFGGIDNASVFQAFGIAAATALFVGSIAITISVLRIGGRLVVFSFVVLSAGYLIGGYLFDSLILRELSQPVTTTWLTPLHPLLTLEASLLNNTYPTPTLASLTGHSSFSIFYLTNPFETYIILTTTISAILMLFCSVMLRDITEILEKTKRVIAKIVSGDQERAGRRVWKNPIAWREANARSRKNGMIMLLCAAGTAIITAIPAVYLLFQIGNISYGSFAFIFAAIFGFFTWVLALVGSALAAGRWRILTAVAGVIPGLFLLVTYHNQALPAVIRAGVAPAQLQAESFHNYLSILIFIQLTVIVLVAVYVSSGSISKEREDGTLDLMLTTPITPKEYLWGKLRGLISFLSLLIAVPVLTLATVSVYVIMGSIFDWSQIEAQYQNGRVTGMIMLPEAPILLLFVLVPFVAFCAILGMGRSVKSKGVLGAVIPTFAIIFIVASIASLCGLNAIQEIPILGPILNAFSPFTHFMAITQPWALISDFSFQAEARVSIAVASLVAMGVYFGSVYATHHNIVKTFDFNVRKLSGNAGP